MLGMYLPNKLLIFLSVAVLAIPALSQGLASFENGTVADADAINSNFSVLDGRLSTLESEGASYSGSNIIGYSRVLVDCAANNLALVEAIGSLDPKIDRVKFEISGECQEWQYPIVPGFQGKSIVIGGQLEGGTCNPELPTIGSGSASITLGIAGGSLWVNCVKFDADATYINAYAHAYVRLEGISVKTADQVLEARLLNNSTLRVFSGGGATHFDAIKATNGSVVNIKYGAGTVGQLRLNASSVLWCEFCTGRIESLTLREASSATLWPSGSNLTIGTLDATQRSITFINSLYGTVAIENQSESSTVDIRSEPFNF